MATSEDVPGLFDVAIDGVAYRARSEVHSRKFHETIKQQADTSSEPSEASLNPQDLWRRGADDWRHGEGQEFYDGSESSRMRYDLSVGVDPWTEHELTLLKDVSSLGAPSGTKGQAVLCGDQVFVVNGNRVDHWNGSTWGSSNTTPQPIVDIATDGTTVYLAVRDSGKTTGGIYVVNTATDSPTYTPVLLNSVIPDRVAYVSGRLMVAAGYSLYNITDVGSTSPPEAFTAAAINSQWEWNCFASGPGFIYVAGNANDTSMIYRVTIREDGTALTPPVVASILPDGEIVHAMTYYLGTLVLATSKGLRLSMVQGGGLPYGALVDIGETVSLEAQDKFVWAGMTDGTLTRLDLSRFVPNFDLLPARAADLDAPASGNVTSVLTWNDRRLFVVGSQVYLEDAATWLTSGTHRSGRITYGLIDPKQFIFLDVRAELTGSQQVEVELAIDGGGDVALGTLTAADPEQTFTITDTVADPQGEYAEVVLTLVGDGLSSPKVTRWVLRANPVVARTEQVRLIVELYEAVLAYSDQEHHQDVWARFEALQALARSGEVVDYQEFGRTYKASVDNVQWGPELKVAGDRQAWEGPCQVTLKVYP